MGTHTYKLLLYIIDFHSNYNVNGSILRYKKLRALQGFRIFRRTTKFRKFTFGVSKNTSVRKTYIKKKRKSSNIIFQKLTHYWCYSYLKKRSLENFFYLMFAFAYSVPVPHVRFIYKKILHKSFVDPLTLNSSSVSQRIVYNNSVFRKSRLYFKDTLRYHEGSYVTFSRLNFRALSFAKLLPWGVLFDRHVYSFRTLNKSGLSRSQHSMLFASLLDTILRLVLQLTLTLRKVITVLTMRP